MANNDDCERCWGQGEYERGPTNRGTNDTSPLYVTVECEVCGGSGLAFDSTELDRTVGLIERHNQEMADRARDTALEQDAQVHAEWDRNR